MLEPVARSLGRTRIAELFCGEENHVLRQASEIMRELRAPEESAGLELATPGLYRCDVSVESAESERAGGDLSRQRKRNTVARGAPER